MSVIFISGSGRSGTTVLERVLHATTDCTAVGEFHCLWRVGLDTINCSCGQPAATDPFWQQVLADACIGGGQLVELRRLEQGIARSGFIARHGYSLARLRQSAQVQQFLDLQFRLFSAIEAHTGRSIVVDSSKAGPRAWIMACDPRVQIVHVYRAPADVIASWRARKFDAGLGEDMQRLSLSRAALDWWKAEFLVRRLAQQCQVHMIDYHAFCRQPRWVIDDALTALGLPRSQPAGWLKDNQTVPTLDYHSLNGNPDRFDRDPLTISVRKSDWSRYEPAEARAIRALGTALSAVYRPPAGRA